VKQGPVLGLSGAFIRYELPKTIAISRNYSITTNLPWILAEFLLSRFFLAKLQPLSCAVIKSKVPRIPREK
jgi:hypothetical protein